jgi:hypothetical protein
MADVSIDMINHDVERHGWVMGEGESECFCFLSLTLEELMTWQM